MAADTKAFAKHYAGMADEDIQRLSLDVQDLVPEAREALRREMHRRQMPIASIDWQAQPVQEDVQENGQEIEEDVEKVQKDDQGPRTQPRGFAWNWKVILFLLLAVSFLTLIGFSLPAWAEVGTGEALYFLFKVGLLLTLISGPVISGRSIPRQTKILLILVVWVPIALFMLYVALS